MGKTMELHHLPQNCKWAELTVLQPMPLWLEAWTCQWTCLAGGAPRVIEASEECTDCPRWEERPAPAQTTGDGPVNQPPKEQDRQ
jgi:hypothetical protein